MLGTRKWPIRHYHISHNAPYLRPKILRKHCFQFLLGRLQYPGEMKNKGYAKFGGQIICIMGNVEVANWNNEKRYSYVCVPALLVFIRTLPVCFSNLKSQF